MYYQKLDSHQILSVFFVDQTAPGEKRSGVYQCVTDDGKLWECQFVEEVGASRWAHIGILPIRSGSRYLGPSGQNRTPEFYGT